MSIEWRYIKKVSDEQTSSVVSFLGHDFPEDYLRIVINNNAGKPSKELFKIKGGAEKVFNYLLDFDQIEKNNIITINNVLKKEYNLPSKIVAIADDPFGNFICLEFNDETHPRIIFWDHETNSIELIANSFNEFLEMLY